MVDLGKYSDKTKYGVFNWPLRYCTVGKKIPNPKTRKETLVKEIHFDTLLRILKQTDWQKTPVFELYREHGRWKHTDDTIYSEMEIKYLISTMTHMVKEPQYEDFNQNEGQLIIEKHWGKTVRTL